MASRLDRLFVLLDTGSNESVRLAAAKQLGEVQRIQPNDLHYLLKRIKEYSRKSLWETRIAAGHAIRCVIEHVEAWPPGKSIGAESETKDEDKSIRSVLTGCARTEQILQNVDLAKVVSICPTLLSTSTIEIDDLELVGPSSNKRSKIRKTSTSKGSKKSTKEQLMRQRHLINKELGISMADSLNLGVKSTDIISNDDLEYADNGDSIIPPEDTTSTKQKDIIQSLNGLISNYKRFIDTLVRDGSITESKQPDDQQDDIYSGDIWPLGEITNDYTYDLFNPSWETRHGAAIALREIVRQHGRSAGRRANLNQETNDYLNQLWLVDTALVSLCVLSLDRFGDFLFDQVVAPVRENTAQLLGCCVANMSHHNSSQIIGILLKMLKDDSWETRHGGILGLKYSMNVLNIDLIKSNSSICFDAIFECLGDINDDVSAEAAAALVPVKDVLIETIPDKMPRLIKFLWEHIAELDELTTSTSNIILLLASLITSSSTQLEPSELIASVPKLWPLLGHSSTNVRVSVLKALITLIKPQKVASLSWMPGELLSTALSLIFQRSLLENTDEVRPLIEEVWCELISVNKNDPTVTSAEQLSLLHATSQCLNYWLCLTMQPSNVPIDRGNPCWLNIRSDGTKTDEKPDGEIYLASSTFNAETLEQQKTQIIRCRLLGTKLLGVLYYALVKGGDLGAIKTAHIEETLKYLSDLFTHYLRTKSANQRMISGWALESWASYQAEIVHVCDNKESATFNSLVLPENLKQQLESSIQEVNLCYDELATSITRMQHEAREFVSSIVAAKIVTNFPYASDRRLIYNLNQLQSMCDLNIGKALSELNSKRAKNDAGDQATERTSCDMYHIKNSEEYSQLINKQLLLSKSYQATKIIQKSYSTSALSSLARGLIAWRSIPERLKLITEPLLESIEIEVEPILLNKSISYLIRLFDIFIESDSEQHNQLVEAIINRLVDDINSKSVQQFEESSHDASKIIQLDNLQRKAETSGGRAGGGNSRRQSSINSTSGQNLKRSLSLTSTSSEVFENNESSSETALEVKHRGVTLALGEITRHFSDQLPLRLPKFWSVVTSDFSSECSRYIDSNNNDQRPPLGLIRGLILLESIGEYIDTSLLPDLLPIYEDCIRILGSNNPFIRHHSSQCVGLLSKLMFDKVEPIIQKRIIAMLEPNTQSKTLPSGAIEAIALIIDYLKLDLVPRINDFIVPVLKRMSDQNDQVRLMATHCFGKLLSLMPLNLEKRKVAEKCDIEPTIKSEQQDDIHHNAECEFIEQLLDPKKLADFKIPFETQAQLRSYQQEGLNWLEFLNKFNLHGILCDEMGLGKTFMTICIVASHHFSKEKKTSDCHPPSLIVCPSTLIEHWLYEIEKFVPTHARAVLNPVAYVGSIGDRMYLRQRVTDILSEHRVATKTETSSDEHKKPMNIIITSYDVLRNDIDFFKAVNWNYCVLDEGHIIKNGKTKLSRAIRLLTASHRLILSGTPIQNNVTELWSLFDFLMPGFLGSERQFNSRFTKPILQSREPKCSPRELEAGALAMESLHRQVLPFILRRLKGDVLDDLPPKILQDYYCELSPLQFKLYEDFTRSKLCKNVTRKSLNQLASHDSHPSAKDDSKSHVFQALQYLKNVCNHPKLVLTPRHTQYKEIKKMLEADRNSLDNVLHSSKLMALKQLLIDCGIGVASQAVDDVPSSHQKSAVISNQTTATTSMELESVVNQHRALIFCQLRSMVEIIENDLLKTYLSNITYLKLDGTVPVNQRHSIVSRFNNDPSIDILLLTTQIGGLGLNLTGADTVIFVEHDWNPTRDLQAMDRAHRIGQKKVVNVYRLITKGTLEEKIMGLQKFKTMVSSTVINQDNTGLGTMNVDQLLDLFDDQPKGKVYEGDRQTTSERQRRVSGSHFMNLLPELWDQQQYETEYDLSTFVSSIKS